MTSEEDLLDESTVLAYLASRGILRADGGPANAVMLDGGVSSVVLRVTDGDHDFVVKQALPQLKVAQKWLAPRERTLTEGRALNWFNTLTPDNVPGFIDLDDQRLVLTMTAAPLSAASWKTDLLAGAVDPDVGHTLGTVLATWHAPVGVGDRLVGMFDDPESFRQLRLDPYFGPILHTRPDVAVSLRAQLDVMADRHDCLVHGDFSPKNVMVWEGGCWVLDFEVTHLGDPAFDVAFLLHHLLMKAIHRPQWRGGYAAAGLRFTSAYRAIRAIDEEHATALTGALLLARVLGKSRAEYLTESERARVERLGLEFLNHPDESIDDVLTHGTEGDS
jgi:tRNA A-37 threonylcarbamoyl transferase component Bud32